jgi:hypothetical protein
VLAALAAGLADSLVDSFVVVKALTGDVALTFRASFKTRWLRRVPLRRGLVRFLGLPIGNTPQALNINTTWPHFTVSTPENQPILFKDID